MKKLEKLKKRYQELLDEQNKLKQMIKDTHIDIEWLDKEKNVFQLSRLWEVGSSLKKILSQKK